MSTVNTLPAGTWHVDPAATTVTVTVKKLGFITVPATVAVTSGVIVIDDAGDVASVEVSLDASSYASKNDKRNEHVVSADFLDAANHPTLGFQATKVSGGSGSYTAVGPVTVKGTTSPAELAVTEVHVDGSAGSFVARTTLDRKAIGVDKMPGFIIGTNLDIVVNAAVTRP